MRILFSILLFCLLAGCSSQRAALKEERRSWGFRQWPGEFKQRAFCLCLLEGYRDENVKQFILKTDKSYFDGVAIAIFDSVLHPVIREEVERMIADSIRSGNLVAEPAVGKRVFDHCLKFYESKKLDSLTRKEKRGWKHIKSIEEEVHRKIPSY